MNMVRGRNNRKTPTVCRFGWTHGREGVPKIIRENTEQFFASVTETVPKVKVGSKIKFTTESQPKQQSKKNRTNGKIHNLFKTPTPKPVTPVPVVVIPPIQRTTSRRSKSASTSSSACIHQTILPPIIPPSNNAFESNSLTKSLTTISQAPKEQIRYNSPVDQDIFRRAYERALSVARSRLLFHDPYSLTRASASHGILYSYYDHTPMCIFSRGSSCSHYQEKKTTKERKTKSELSRRNIFHDVVVEHYIR